MTSKAANTKLRVRPSLRALSMFPCSSVKPSIFSTSGRKGIYIDATLGAGGHAQEILKRLGSGRLLGLDRDPQALEVAGEKLAGFGEKLIMQHGNFAQIDALHAASGLPPADGVVADLGLSSMQLDDASRGFSFNLPGPLDMRMDPGSRNDRRRPGEPRQ